MTDEPPTGPDRPADEQPSDHPGWLDTPDSDAARRPAPTTSAATDQTATDAAPENPAAPPQSGPPPAGPPPAGPPPAGPPPSGGPPPGWYPGYGYPGFPYARPNAAAAPVGPRPSLREWAGWRRRPWSMLIAALVALGLVGGGFALADASHGGQEQRGRTTVSDGRARANRDGAVDGPTRNARDGRGATNTERVSGTVSAISSTSVTIKNANGSLTFSISPNTPVSGTSTNTSSITVGDSVTVIATTPAGNSAAQVQRLVVG